jgi:hypothetical protein
MAFKKTPQEKFQTKLNKLLVENGAVEKNKKIKIGTKIFFQYSKTQIKYLKKRFYPFRKLDIIEEDFEVIIPINHNNLNLFSANPINPPSGAKRIIDLFRNATRINYDLITLGYKENKILGNQIYITKELYDIILQIDKEEGKEKNVRVNNRITPFMQSQYQLTPKNADLNKDYSLILKEIIASGQITQTDLISLSSNLESGEANQVIIEKQVSKQVRWLIETIESIIEEKELNSLKSKDLGNSLFGFNKIDITGPEHLMEMILSKYGQYTLFGVPALLNTNKYVKSEGISNSQFDIILITHLGDIEVVELKRPDQKILEYDKSRGKFYPSKDLSIAISQAERYISAVNKDNDEEYSIDGKKIREFINHEIGGTLYVESVRPSAIIIIGSWSTITKDYSKLDFETKKKVTKQDYDNNGLRAYKELKSSFKNIKLLNYSELLEHARTRLEFMKEK